MAQYEEVIDPMVTKRDELLVLMREWRIFLGERSVSSLVAVLTGKLRIVPNPQIKNPPLASLYCPFQDTITRTLFTIVMFVCDYTSKSCVMCWSIFFNSLFWKTFILLVKLENHSQLHPVRLKMPSGIWITLIDLVVNNNAIISVGHWCILLKIALLNA